VRIRRRALGLLLGAAVLFLIGTNVQAGWLYVLCALLLGAVFTGVLLPFAALRGLRAELIAPAETEQGGEAFVDVRLSNTARGVRWSVVVADAHLEHAEVFVPSVHPGERVELTTLRTPATRGEIVTHRLEVRSSAPFGVAERRRHLVVDAGTLVLPRVFPLGSMPFVDATPTNDTGIHPSPRRGHGPEYLGVREYRSGDSMRHVHWGLTARHGQVMVREFEQEQTRRLAVVIDTERDEGEAWTPLDRACSVAASLLDAASAHGHGARLAAARKPLFRIEWKSTTSSKRRRRSSAEKRRQVRAARPTRPHRSASRSSPRGNTSTSSSHGWPRRRLAEAGSTSQQSCAPAKAARRALAAGSVRTTSPTAPRRITRTRSASGGRGRAFRQRTIGQPRVPRGGC